MFSFRLPGARPLPIRTRGRLRLAGPVAAIVLALGSLPGPATAQQDLPLEVQTDLAMLEFERAVTGKDPATILAAIDKVRALSPALAAGDMLFFEAEAAMATGDMPRAEAALNQFVTSVGRGSELYPLALEMLLDLQGTAADRAKAQEALAACEAAGVSETAVAGEELKTAIGICRDGVAANPGDGRAAFLLGRMLVTADRREEAVPFFQSAAEAGDTDAMIILAEYHVFGIVVPTNERQAEELLLRAAAVGAVRAHLMLSWLYDDADTRSDANMVVDDPERALFHLRAAAEAGSGDAMFFLGFAHEEGRLVPRDDAEAVRWYRDAIDAGEWGSLSALAMMYEAGRGVEQDFTQAAALFLASERAGQRGFRSASSQRDRETVRALQRLLREAGHDPGEIEGVYTPETRRALDAYVAAAD